MKKASSHDKKRLTLVMKKVSPHERTLRQLGGESWKTGVRPLEL
ncbi:hypothetical protein [Alloprevotella tannerae]